MPFSIRGAEALPAHAIAEEVNSQLATHTSLVITAPPGAGKSTLLPLTILSGTEGRVLVLEPRRLAARQIAERMASMIGEAVGHTVGYRVRHESRTSAATRVEVITEGILTRMLIDDPTLEGVSTIIFDEFHERSLHSDVALALARESQEIVRPDLRIVIMSATIDTEEICQALHAPLVESEGRMFPVEVRYADEIDWNNMREGTAAFARTLISAHREQEGDILAFLPGEGEIRLCQELLGTALGRTHICPLYGMLSAEEQRLAIAPSLPGERKVVLATSIAETSITIEGVRVVVDSGLCRRMAYDARTGLSRLETARVSMDMARQRMGRAGRVAPGVCYRLWSRAAECRMEECRRPEILEADLTTMVLDVAVWGESQPERLAWLTPPPRTNVIKAANLLQILGATDHQGHATAHGRKLWRLPYHPRLAQMLVRAQSDGQQKLARRIAEILEAPPSSWPAHLDQPGAGQLLAYAYPERIARQLPEGIGRYRLACGDTATVDPNDHLTSHEWIAIASMNATGNGRVFLAAPLAAEDLEEHIELRDNLCWDNKQGRIIAQRERRIGTLLVDSRPLHDCPHELIVKTLCEAATKWGTSMFSFNDDVLHLQRRVAAVAEWHPELGLPSLATEEVLPRAAEWLPLYAGNAKTAAELKKLNFCEVLWGMLTYEQQMAVDQLAPTHITLPHGRRVRVEYRVGAELPIIRVKLQECFGMYETPRLDNGQRPVLIELLSPGFKPVQLTQDLAGFWDKTYFEVRKELRRRYPKHAWPDDPRSIR